AHLPALTRWCDHAETTRRIVKKKYGNRLTAAIAHAAAKENVLVQLQHLETHPAVAVRLATNAVRLFGWYYDIASGEVAQYDPTLGHFRPLGEETCSVELAPVISGAAEHC